MISFIIITQVPRYEEFMVKCLTITVEADENRTLNEKILPRQQEVISLALKRKFVFKENVWKRLYQNKR